MMDLNPNNHKKSAVSLAYQSGVGIGVVFIALLTGLPAAWELEDLRRPFVLYLSGVSVGLFSAVVLLLFMVAGKEAQTRWHRIVTANLCLAGLAIFAFSTIAFSFYLVRLTR